MLGGERFGPLPPHGTNAGGDALSRTACRDSRTCVPVFYPMALAGTVADYSDHEAYKAMVRKSAKFGFEGASCIHPAIVPMLNEGFTPAKEDEDLARRIVDAWDENEADGRGSFELDGKSDRRPGRSLRAQRVIAKMRCHSR